VAAVAGSGPETRNARGRDGRPAPVPAVPEEARSRQRARLVPPPGRVLGTGFYVLGNGARIARERLRQAIAQAQFATTSGQPETAITLSIGVAAYPDSTDRPEQLLELADLAGIVRWSSKIPYESDCRQSGSCAIM